MSFQNRVAMVIHMLVHYRHLREDHHFYVRGRHGLAGFQCSCGKRIGETEVTE